MDITLDNNMFYLKKQSLFVEIVVNNSFGCFLSVDIVFSNAIWRKNCLTVPLLLLQQ